MQEALDDGKGTDIRVLSVERQSGGLFSHMIVTTANSSRHATALAERARQALKAAGLPTGHSESGGDKSWVLVDAGDVVVHIMLAEARTHYDLESLWGFEEVGE